MKIIYVTRHSKPMRDLFGNYNTKESTQLRNEKNILSVEGEISAKELSDLPCLKEVGKIYSSHYVRAMSTAKYVSLKNNLPINVDERLGERKFGVNQMKDLPIDFFEKQFEDWDYKINDGESLNDTSKRMQEILFEILNNYSVPVLIVSHGTAIQAMLSKWCNYKYNSSIESNTIYFNNEIVFDRKWDAPELFKLIFNDNNDLISLENINKNK